MNVCYAPWRDDALMPEESAYSLISKVAWFHGTPAAEFLFEQQKATGQWKKPPRVVRLHTPDWWMPFLGDRQLEPIILGRSLSAELADRTEIDPAWLSHALRHCPTCLRDGIHLRIHQHRALLQCPVHRQPLSTRCPHCNAELYYVAHRGVPAFTCPTCRHDWLRRKLEPFRYEAAFRARVAAGTTHMREVLERVLPQGQVKCGISNPELTDRELETSWTGQTLWLGASKSGAASLPSWLRVATLAAGVTVDRIRLPLRSLAPRATDRPCEGGPENLACHDNARDAVRLGMDRLRAAVRRVATMVMSQCAPTHSQCLELPYRLFEHPTVIAQRDYADLMGCCPVGLGFWLWRQAAATMLEHREFEDYFHPRVSGCDLDKVCYDNAKSHLHYCIASAVEIIRLGKQDRASSWAEMLSLLARSEWNPLVEEVRSEGATGWWIEHGGHAWNLRFRASALIDNLPCPGAGAYSAYWQRIVGLMRRSRRRVILGPDDATTPECWLGRLDVPANRSPSDLRDFTSRTARPEFCRTRLGFPVPGFQIVDAAINERGAYAKGEVGLRELVSMFAEGNGQGSTPHSPPAHRGTPPKSRDGADEPSGAPRLVPARKSGARPKLQPSSDDIVIIRDCCAAEARRRCGRSQAVIQRWRSEILGVPASSTAPRSRPASRVSAAGSSDPSSMRRKGVQPTARDIAIIKSSSNTEACRRCGRSMDTIRRWRAEFVSETASRGGRPRHTLPPGLAGQLGLLSDVELARRFNVPKRSVRNHRIRLGIPAHGRRAVQTR